MTEQTSNLNSSQTLHSIASLLNLSTLKTPPLRNWRTGDSAEDQLKSTRFRACVSILALAIPAIITVCIWLW